MNTSLPISRRALGSEGPGSKWPGTIWIWEHRQPLIVTLAVIGIACHLVLRFATSASPRTQIWPLWLVLGLGGMPLVGELTAKLVRGQFGSDLLAGISIVTSVILHEYLAGAIVVLMLSGGEAIESFAIDRASSALKALANRLPAVAHRRNIERIIDVALDQVTPGDTLVVFPHEICPADGVVLEGHGAMDEAFLTGEPFRISKAPGANVLCGAMNGDTALTIRAEKPASDSRYERIIEVMRSSEQSAPRLRRLGDTLGAAYTPIAVAIGIAAWLLSGNASRFLAVMVVATPCPLLIAIPVGIIGAISLAARRGIIVRKAAVLEQADTCRTMIFDKTGTLTYGKPALSELLTASGFDDDEVLMLVASLERYSKHPLARAVVSAAEEHKLATHEPARVSELPGKGLSGIVNGHEIQVTGRAALGPALASALPEVKEGLECVVLIDGQYAATFRFADEIKPSSRSFVKHLGPQHHVRELVLLSGDRKREVQKLGERVGIARAYFEQSPEQKLQFVKEETKRARTLYVGDGINDAPALAAATVGVAMGSDGQIAGEAAGVVILDSSMQRVDEFLHISRRMRKIILQSAVGGMALSVVGMGLASTGHLPPVAGALCQEAIDVLAVINALRTAIPPRVLTDFNV